MPTATTNTKQRGNRVEQPFFPFQGGWNDTVPHLLLDPHYMTKADNIEYTQGGGRRKRGGTAKVNSTALESGATIMGGTDYKQTTSNTITQTQVFHVGTKVKKYDGSSFTDIKTGLESGKIPSYAVFRGKLIFTSNSDLDVPQVMDNPGDTSVSNLGGSPPNFSIIAVHRNRLWGAGQNADPSSLNFCKANDETGWSGSGAGALIIDPGDGDKITGVAGGVFDFMVCFKERSYHLITGVDLTDFSRVPRRLGIGAVSHNSIVPIGTDVFFVSRHGIHSLAQTEKYGDLETAFLSYPIRTAFNNLKQGNLKEAWGVHDARNNRVIWGLANAGSSQNDVILVYDYREQKWSKWSGPKPACLFTVDTTTGDEVWMGDYSGFTLRMNRAAKNDAGSAYTATIIPGFITLGDPATIKRYRYICTHLKGSGDNITLNYQVDGRGTNITLTPAAEGGIWGTDTWGNFLWGGSTVRTIVTRIDQVGRNLRVSYSQGGSNEDMELYGIEVVADVLRKDTSLN